MLGRHIDRMFEQLSRPAVVCFCHGLLGCCYHFVDPAHELNVFFRGLQSGQRVQIGRVGIKPAHVVLVDRFHVVPNCAVITAHTQMLIK